MLRNVLDAVEAAAPGLQHVHLIEGAKWYGVHLGAFPTPAREDDPRHMPPNFYYDQEDLLRERQRGTAWAWSSSRPNVICDFAPERARNLPSTLGAYAAITAELGMALDFPGRAGTYGALTELTDATLLARGLVAHRHHRGLPQPGLQHHQRRRRPLVAAVAAPRRLLRTEGRHRAARCG